ncbi:MAG: hypothetical protein ACYC09_13985 [Bacteroidota bacterium]
MSTPFYKEIGRQQEMQRHTNFRNLAAERLARRFGFVGTARMLFFYPIAFDTAILPGQRALQPVKTIPFLIHTN